MRGKGGWFFAVAAIAATLLSGCAGRDSAGSVPLPPPSREVLPNGLRLIIQEHHASKTVALQLWVGVGGRDEAPSGAASPLRRAHAFKKETLGPASWTRRSGASGTDQRRHRWTSPITTLLPSPRAARASGLRGVQLASIGWLGRSGRSSSRGAARRGQPSISFGRLMKIFHGIPVRSVWESIASGSDPGNLGGYYRHFMSRRT
jgi:hypothetical protein